MMLSAFSRLLPAAPRKPRGLTCAALAGSALLSACGSAPPDRPAAPTPQRTVEAPPRDPYRVLPTAPVTPAHLQGRRAVRIALLAPFSSTNAAVREEAQTLQAAAELALFEHSDGSHILLPKDSGDTPEEAAAAVRGALQGGADFVLGPLFASGVVAIAPYGRSNSAPIFSFSTDTSEAGRGVYVLTFLPEDETTRIIRYAGSQGIRRLAIVAPTGRYGDRVEQAARDTAAAAGITFAGAERYDPQVTGAAADAARRTAVLMQGVARGQGAVLIPERGALLRTIAQSLTQAGAPASRVRYLGTGLWNDADTLTDGRLAGGWFVTPDAQARASFEQRFRAAYGRRPTRLAGMGYDSTALLARMTPGGDKSAAGVRAIETPDGFVGVDGLFRFERGVVQRAMSINEAGPRGGRVVDAAPQRF